MLVSLFNFLFFFLLFSLLRFRIRVRVTLWSYYYTSVTSDDMVTVTVTSYKIIEKDKEDSKRIMSYNICNTWLFRIG